MITIRYISYLKIDFLTSQKMTKTLRHIAYLFFFLLFLILTPIFIGYALGYRYNFNTKVIEQNGAFYVKSYPRDANILIDNQVINKTTPSQITNVHPGEHQLIVNKDKYLPWSKTLTVYPGETTFAEDIVLFLENRDKTDLGSGSDNFIINQAKDKYAYLDKENKLIITDIEQAKNLEISTLETAYDLISWSSDNQLLLLGSESAFYIFDINQKSTTLIDALPANLNKIIWDNQNSRLLWFNQNDQLFKVDFTNLNEPKIETFFDNNVLDFAIDQDFLAILYNQNNKYIVEQYNKKDWKSIQIIDDLNFGNLDILASSDSQIVFTLGSQLYVKNIYKNLVNIPITMAKIFGDRILLTNGYEIILYNFNQEWQDLVDRSTQIVSDLVWHPNGSYFVSEINGQTKIAELDGRNVRNTVELLDDPHKKFYIFNKKGDRLFILTKDANYYLTIQ